MPTQIAQKVFFPTYLPGYLPSGFAIDPRSFSIEDGQAVVFQALNRNNVNIAVSEEATPAKFDFTGFYQNNLANVTNLQHVPFTAVAGDIKGGNRTMLSVNTGQTWLIFTTVEHFDTATLQKIVTHLYH